MEISDLVQRFSDTPQHQRKAIFSQLMIAATRLQTVFDQEIPQITLKQSDRTRYDLYRHTAAADSD